MGNAEQGSAGESPAVSVLRDGFERVHEGIEALLAEAEPRMLRFRPSANANSMAWLIWHLSRVQDDHFTHLSLALGHEQSFEQCWIAHRWSQKFNLPYPVLDTGYGHRSEQVADFGMYDGEYLLGYHRDVHSQTSDILDTLHEAELAAVIDKHWTPPVTASSRLVSVLNETTAHLAQAQFLAGIYGDSTASETSTG